MKTLVILASLILISTAGAADRDNPVYTQCTVDFPNGLTDGVCKNVGEKHYLFYTCEGSFIAYIEPGALPMLERPTCGPNYKGYEESLRHK